MQPDAIPVRALSSVATLPPDAVRQLFGASASLRGTERVEIVRLGQPCASVAVQPGTTLALVLGRIDAESVGEVSGLRLQGPLGVLDAPPPSPVRSTLTVPAALKSAWRMGDAATVALGGVAVRVPVKAGEGLELGIDRALWLGAGSPETARWLPQTVWAEAPSTDPPDADPRVAVVARRVVTETDVRQARLRRQRIRLTPGQIVTPAARSLAREHGVFESDGDGAERQR